VFTRYGGFTAALLWLEFMVSVEGQKIFDEHWPLGASVLSPGSAQQELTRGKKLSLCRMESHEQSGKLPDEDCGGYGFSQRQIAAQSDMVPTAVFREKVNP
jgi:hypothetical protein